MTLQNRVRHVDSLAAVLSLHMSQQHSLLWHGQQRAAFNEEALQSGEILPCRWLMEGLWHGIVCFFVPLLALGQSRKNGTTNGLFSYGVATYTALIIIVNLKVCLCTYQE